MTLTDAMIRHGLRDGAEVYAEHRMREMSPLRVFIGYDSKEPSAFAVLSHSILTRCSRPVEIVPLVQHSLRSVGAYTRERGPTESTEFSLTRFLVPYLSGFTGQSLFLDCDILCRVDLVTLWDEAYRAAFHANEIGNPESAVYCVQHDYTPSETVKFLGNPQTIYPRKNWSSVMLFNNARCRMLTPEYVNHATGLQLHRFQWLRDEEIGSLGAYWNHLVGEYRPMGHLQANPSLVHWTLGGPWFDAYRDTEYADEWFAERDAMLGVAVAA